MPERSLGESIGNSENLIVSGKGGVGKSTTSASIALEFSSKALNTIGVDVDAAHSLGDSLGLDIDDTREGTFSMDYNDNLKLYFLSQIIPDIYDDEKHAKLNSYLDSLLDLDDSFLPLLRLAIHPKFAGMPLPYENAAYVLQLIELFSKDSMYTIEGFEIERKKLDTKFDRILIDSENTRGLMRVIHTVMDILDTLKNIHEAFYGSTIEKTKKLTTKVAVRGQDNLNTLRKTDIIKNYKNFINDVVDFHTKLFNASIIIVTQPGYNDLNQTLKEIEHLKKLGIEPKHILVNKYRDHFDRNPKATSEIYNELSRFLNGSEIGISKIDAEFTIMDPRASSSEKKHITEENLGNMAKTFEL